MARTALAPERLAAASRHEVAAIDRDIPVYGIQTMEDYVAQSTEQSRLSVMLLAIFWRVGARARDHRDLRRPLVSREPANQRDWNPDGTRATRSDVMHLIVGHGMILTILGMTIGLAGAWAITAALRNLLFGISPHDPATYVCIIALLEIIAFLACYLPGRRATRVNPVVTLRYE